MIFGVDNGTALFKRSENPNYDYVKLYSDWIKTIRLERTFGLYNFGNFGGGEFLRINFENHIKNFAMFPYPAYNHLQNLNFVPTRQPTILFSLFR